MGYKLEERYKLIRETVIVSKSKNPIEIAKIVMANDFVNMHGPEHHFLDGAVFLVAYKNSGGDIDLDKSLQQLAMRAIEMPGGICGYWGVCGSLASIGASLSIIHDTNALSNDDFYKDHMEYTSSVLQKMSEIGGPRCCKRNAFISITTAVDFVNKKYKVEMEKDAVVCNFYRFNSDCIKNRCPFYKAN
ncbi:MAG: DUF5714 domain-containing protein [Erysipelotrichaceae bacterium]|nr:DUF5714 domain-containing protein [Erysipelotrichaceae bacterium]